MTSSQELCGRPGTGTRWPEWARAQLDVAAAIAATVPTGASTAATLHREWFVPVLRGGRPPRRPLAGLYRAAHSAGSARTPSTGDGEGRRDVIGADGWWRTWGRSWTPPRHRPGAVRLLLTVDPGRLGVFVHDTTSALMAEPLPWSLAMATDPRRVARAGAAVLDLPGDDTPGVVDRLVERLHAYLIPLAQPLCKPLAPGAALAQYPDNGMTFGEHRCHLVALGLRRAGGRDPLASVAEVFAAHGIDPARPYRNR